MKAFISLMLASWSVGLIAGEEIVFSRKSRGVVEKGILLRQREMKMETLLTYCEQVSDQSLLLGRFCFAASREDITQLTAGKGVTDYTYEVWLDDVERYRQHEIGPVGQILASKGACVIRVRDGAGRVQSLTRGDPNPFIRVRETGYEVIDAIPEVYQGQVRSVALFVVTGGNVDIRRAHRIFEALKRAFPLPGLSLSIRNDEWFVADQEFPVLYPFAVSAPPQEPREEFQKRPAVYCRSDGQCDWGPYP